MITDIDRYVSELCRTIKTAVCNYEIWWIYKSEDTRPLYVEAMNKYVLFFRTSIHAHFVALLTALYKLYETRDDTFNIPSLLKMLKAEAQIPGATLDLLEGIYKDEARPLWIKVSILRNKAFAHQSIAYTIEEVFKEAGVAPNELRDLAEVTKELLNKLSHALDRGNPDFDLEMRNDTLRLLDDLKSMLEG